MVTMDETPLGTYDAQLAAQIMGADEVVLSGAFNSDGSQHIDSSDGAWQTDALLVSIAPPQDKIIYAGGGNGFVVGEGGNNTIYAYNYGNPASGGNDVIVGNLATNVTALSSDLPQIVQTLRLVGEASTVHVQLSPLGSVIVPKLTEYPEDLNCMTLPAITGLVGVIPSYVHSEVLGSLPLAGGTTSLVPYMAIIPDVIHHVDVLPGCNTIYAGAGNSLIIGGNLLVYSPLMTGFSTLDARTYNLDDQLVYATQALQTLSVDYDLLEHEEGT
jgi:hypothetical protein